MLTITAISVPKKKYKSSQAAAICDGQLFLLFDSQETPTLLLSMKGPRAKHWM